jgi:hypothetical protein
MQKSNGVKTESNSFDYLRRSDMQKSNGVKTESKGLAFCKDCIIIALWKG